MECVLLEALLNLCWVYLCLTHTHKGNNTQTCIHLCLKDGFSLCFPLNITSMESSAQLRNHRLRRLNALACLSSARSEYQQTKARQFRARSVILAVQSSSYNKVVTVLKLLRASATIPKPWSHFWWKSLGKILFDLLWPQCHPLKIFHWGNYDPNAVLSSESLHAGM